MGERNMSDTARHRLWQCYALLLRLAEEAESNVAETESAEDKTSTVATNTNAVVEWGSYPAEEEDAEEQSEPEAGGI